MYEKEHIYNLILQSVENVTGKIVDETTCLVDRELGVFPADLIYIFEELQKELELPVYRVFEENSYEVMIVNNLVTAIYRLQ